MSVTIYRNKNGRHDFRIVAGSHVALPASEYTRHNYATAAEAFKDAPEHERAALLRIDPDACAQVGTWLRVDKGDGLSTVVSRNEVFEKMHAAKQYPTGSTLRRIMAQWEAGKPPKLALETAFATYEFVPVAAVEVPNNG